MIWVKLVLSLCVLFILILTSLWISTKIANSVFRKNNIPTTRIWELDLRDKSIPLAKLTTIVMVTFVIIGLAILLFRHFGIYIGW